jgi:dTDP-4-amino-4,6-dideoxygalactose transaminase
MNIELAIKKGKLSGNGEFTQRCQRFFEEKYGFGPCFLTHSCTDALEMAAILLDIREGDEVIMPSYTHVSTANAFILRGAKVVFVDSRPDHPGMDESLVEELISSKTRAIVAVHYGGVACDMDILMDLAGKHHLYVVEDAAQAINGFYKGKPLGGIGHLAAFSFHETKNIHCGEGGMLVVNDRQFAPRAEIIWEKGTNRAAFYRHEVDQYQWVDIGSSFLPSEITAAFLYAQLEQLDSIQTRRIEIGKRYQEGFDSWYSAQILQEEGIAPEVEGNYFKSVFDSIPKKAKVRQGVVPLYAAPNVHLFFLVFEDEPMRNAFITCLKKEGILAIFHYLPLHNSPYFGKKHDGRKLPYSEKFGKGLVRLPLYAELINEVEKFG